jgi:hypothetical protein
MKKFATMKHLFTTLAAALLALPAQAEYAVVYGTVVKYKTDPELVKDLPATPKEYLVIRFDKPFEIYHENWQNEDGKDGKVLITEFQLLYGGEDSKRNALIGKKVIAIGETHERDTANQMRPILFLVEPGDIKERPFIPLKTTIGAFPE